MLNSHLHIIIISQLFVFVSHSSGQHDSIASSTHPAKTNHENSIPIPLLKKDSVINNKEGSKDIFFEKLEKNAEKKRWLRGIHNTIVIPPSRYNKDSIITEESTERFYKYDGLIIKSIQLKRLGPFNVSIRDTVVSEGTLLSRTANSLHVKTNERILRKQILFEAGDEINPRILSDNERLLRELPFIEDARIIVEKIEGDTTTANVFIITKDVWSKAFFVELKEINAGKLEIFDKNFFGSGLELQNNIHWDPNKPDKWGYEAIYKNPNILGSFVKSRLHFTNVFDTRSYGYQLEREFFTSDIKYAGGSSSYYLSTIRNIWLPDSGYNIEEKIKMNYFDIWTGRSFTLNPGSDFFRRRLNFIISTRFIRENFFERPEVCSQSFYQYHNKKLWLSSLALSSQNYFKSTLVYSFGRTEDIPAGYLFNLTFGPEFGEFSNRFYTSSSFSVGSFLSNIGYMYSKISFGGFHSPEGRFEQGLFDLKFSWFTNLFVMGDYKFRHFFKVNYLNGYNRYMDEKVYINEPYGIRGFSQKGVFGDKRLVFSAESDIFLPLNPIGFRFVMFGFTDVAFLGDKNVNLLSNDIFTGLGLGFRIRNERLAFPTFQLRFAYYPNIPGLSPSDFIKFLGEERFRPDNFNVHAPSLFNFR